MGLKDILVHLDATERALVRLDLAIDLARTHEARLTGLYVVDLTPPAMALGAEGVGGGVAVAAVFEKMRQDALAEAAEVETVFRERLRLENVSGSWSLMEGITSAEVAARTRYSDLAILGQVDPDGDAPGPGATVEETLFSSGRPVIVVPFAGRFPTVGRNVIVGWTPSREAARALNDALPILARAESNSVVTVETDPRAQLPLEATPANAAAAHLDRHEIGAAVERLVAAEISVGDALLNHATDKSADLLVVGAYSHSRLREIVLGGVTRTLLRQMTLPVLMSH
ncbi:MAG TPA: universal stress protein [Crenalkalicoccus sp.]|nr:universal stress protein [Crenalkalicoccus sp.]